MYATTLEKKISRYLNKFGIKRAMCVEKIGFCYFPQHQKISFSMLTYDADYELIEFVNNKYEINIAPWYFIFCLLHEVGHHFTLSSFSKEELLNERLCRSVMENMNDSNNIYFNLATEVAATEWALTYLSKHPIECWNFQQKCLSIMEHIYKKKSFPY
jgi:hypothetical protein